MYKTFFSSKTKYANNIKPGLEAIFFKRNMMTRKIPVLTRVGSYDVTLDVLVFTGFEALW